MTTIPLSKIVSNPWRNLKLFPLDDAQVEKLVHSINRHGFFGGIRARQSVDGKHVELACGHHRIAAARKAGLTKAEIDVCDMSDDEMIRLMASENAIQAGSKAAAVMNEVSAVTRRLAKAMLTAEHFGQICQKWPEIGECFQGQKGYDIARGKLLGEAGIGKELVRAYLGNGDEDQCPRDAHTIRDGLAALKACGTYATIINGVRDEIAIEQEEAEREAREAEREAERTAASAKTKREKARAKKARTKADNAKKRQTSTTKARASAEKAAETSSEKHARTFDERCLTVFVNDDQFRAFREAVTSESGQRFIPIDQQYKLAKHLMDEHVGAGNKTLRDENRTRISAAYIKTYVAGVISDAIRAERDLDEKEKQRMIEMQEEQVLLGEIKNLLWATRSVAYVGGRLLTLLKKNPKWKRDARLGAAIVKIDEGIAMLNALKETANDTDTSKEKAARQISHDDHATSLA